MEICAMRTLSDFDLDQLGDEFARQGFPAVHARRILRAFYRSHGEVDLGALTVGNVLRDWLARNMGARQSRVLRRHVSADGTVKLLVGFDPRGAVETVLMPSHRPDRAAACVSSQVGCAMGCDFCASTKEGLARDLSAGEIVEQFLHVAREAAADGRRISSLVFMGMGEPLLNIDSVVEAIHRIADRSLGAVGYRNVSVSTVGIVPGIDRLADADLGVHLALSLHAPDDATRSRLVPANRRWRVREIVEAAQRFQSRTGRPVNVEYCMLAGVNDSDEQARLLAGLLRDWRAHVNLIPYNAIGAGLSGAVYQRPAPERVERFTQLLRDEGVVTHVRQTRGDDVAAACGQLRVFSLSPSRGEGRGER
jgi:23S rRNA (adenine2503-C2)-methyltransferase